MGGFFGKIFPHLPFYQFFADDLNQINQSIEKALTFDSDTYYVGHGGPLKRKRIERRFR